MTDPPPAAKSNRKSEEEDEPFTDPTPPAVRLPAPRQPLTLSFRPQGGIYAQARRMRPPEGAVSRVEETGKE